MKELRKKSADAGVNQLIVKANREQVELSWDRAEALQPQCGFSRLAICCTDCLEGPCRVNPFAEGEQPKTVCGRGQQELVANFVLRKAADGAAALAKLATEFGAEVSSSAWHSLAQTADSMTSCNKRLGKLGEGIAEVLVNISGAQGHDRQATSAGLGVLETGRPNIVVHGHVAPAKVLALVKAAGADANLVGICGNERMLPTVANYESQETVLLSGFVDLLVVGGQCVTPAILALAEKLAVPVIRAADLEATQAIAAAKTSFERRAGKANGAAFSKQNSAIGYDAVAISKGLVYLGGCGNVSQTQDAAFLKAASLIAGAGYTVVTSGCSGTALAKAGLSNGSSVVNLGSCHDAGAFLQLAAQAKAGGLPVFAVLPELTHNKTFATAVACATKGIPTWVSLGDATLPEGLLDGNLRTFSGVKELPQLLAEAK